jgi:hypothetical protein
MKKPSAPFIFPVVCIFFSLSPPAAWSQDFTSLDRDLAELENLIQDTLVNSEVQLKQLEDLQRNLNESETLLKNYENIIDLFENPVGSRTSPAKCPAFCCFQRNLFGN